MTARLDRLISLASSTGLTIDYWESLTSNLDGKSLAILCGNASKLPKIMKSIDSPYVSRRTIQLSKDGR